MTSLALFYLALLLLVLLFVLDLHPRPSDFRLYRRLRGGVWIKRDRTVWGRRWVRDSPLNRGLPTHALEVEEW